MKYQQFDVVVVRFPFIEHEGVCKIRPAVVISGDEYNKKTDFVIVAMITTAKKSKIWGDVELENIDSELLKSKSVIRMKVSTIIKDKIIKKIGALNKSDQNILKKKLKSIF
jgi:mRNA interferase MazF